MREQEYAAVCLGVLLLASTSSLVSALAPADYQPTHPTGVPHGERPLASFFGTVNELNLTVNASGSSDEDGFITTYNWQWGDGRSSQGGPENSHTYAASGNYPVRLEVVDDTGQTNRSTTQFTLLSKNTPPSVAIGSPSSGVRLSRNFSVTGAASDPDGDALTIAVTVGSDPARGATGSFAWRFDVENARYPRGALYIQVVADDGRNVSGPASLTVTLVPAGEGDDDVGGTQSGVGGALRLTVLSPVAGSVLPEDYFLLEGSISGTLGGPYTFDARIGALTLTSATVDGGPFSFEVGTPVLAAGPHKLVVTVTKGSERAVVEVPIEAPAGGDANGGTDGGDGDDAGEVVDGARPTPSINTPALLLALLGAMLVGRRRRT